MTVLENLMMVPPNQFGEKLTYALLNNSKVKEQEEIIREKAIEVINFLKFKTFNTRISWQSIRRSKKTFRVRKNYDG